MISLDELNACIKRNEIIVNNSTDLAEQFIATNIVANLNQLANQLNNFIKHPSFNQAVEEFAKSKEQENQ